MSNITTALSGLQNVSLAIDTVSNNIANANTIGYKSGEYVFATQFVTSSNSSSTPATGQGTQNSGIRRPMTQGAITNSANPLDLAISGTGMFRLLQGSGTAETIDPSAVYYSRNGQFGVDKSGYIVNENGMYLTGYQPSVDGEQITDDLIKNNGLLRMPDNNLFGNATSQSILSAMLDSTSTAFTQQTNVAFDPTQSTYNNKTTQTVFDSSGNSHTLEVYYRRITDGTLSIKSDTSGYTYSPGTSSSANSMGTSLVTLHRDSVLRVNTASKASALSTTSNTSSATLSLNAAPSNAGSTVSVAYMKVFINGIDSGTTVNSNGYSSSAVTLSSAITVPSGAAVTFYPGDNSFTRTTSPTTPSLIGATSFTAPTAVANTGSTYADVAIGDKLFIDGVDTGVTLISKSEANSTNTFTLSAALPTGTAAYTSTAVAFKHPLAMTLATPDGTEIPVTGASNKKDSKELLKTTTSNIEVYASIDGKFYDYIDSSTFSNRKASPEVLGNGYNTVAKVSFMGGQNIDSIAKDAMTGVSIFKTATTLTSRLTNQAGGSTDMVFELDLSGTQLHAGAFQMMKSIQNGEAVARLTNVTVDNEGRIVGVYGSGKQKLIGQVAIVSFQNEGGLTPVGKNAFASSLESGTEQDGNGVSVGRAGIGEMGEIRSQALESSNVDLANELVRLMILQRSYSANSQSLKAIDQVLRDTLQMVS
jgi:flagellar hook protein FlgE